MVTKREVLRRYAEHLTSELLTVMDVISRLGDTDPAYTDTEVYTGAEEVLSVYREYEAADLYDAIGDEVMMMEISNYIDDERERKRNQ